VFLKYLDPKNVRVVFEVGARYGDETLQLKKTFINI